MVRASLSELLEALGAVLIVAGLALWSLPLALVLAGVVLLAVANAPGGRLPSLPPGADDHRVQAEARAKADAAERDALLAALEREAEREALTETDR